MTTCATADATTDPKGRLATSGVYLIDTSDDYRRVYRRWLLAEVHRIYAGWGPREPIAYDHAVAWPGEGLACRGPAF